MTRLRQRRRLSAWKGEQDCYGPALLSVLEYAARMYGVHLEQDTVFWGTVGGYERAFMNRSGGSLL